MTQQITVPFLSVKNSQALLAEAFARGAGEQVKMNEIKIEALRSLGIEVDDSVGEWDIVHVWGRHVHEINDLEFSMPYHPAIVEIIRENPEVYKFFFFLS